MINDDKDYNDIDIVIHHKDDTNQYDTDTLYIVIFISCIIAMIIVIVAALIGCIV